jgi:hypothetical protein
LNVFEFRRRFNPVRAWALRVFAQVRRLRPEFLVLTLEDVRSARKLVLTPLLVYVLWLVATSAFSLAGQLKRQHEQQQQTLQMLEQYQQRQIAILNEQRQIAILNQHNQNLATQRVQTAEATKRTRPDRPSQQKMPASAVVKRLRQVNAFGLVARRERLLHCSDNHGAWDYTCVFHADPIGSTTWVQFGVLVDNAHIIEMSETYPSSAILPPPLSLATR